MYGTHNCDGDPDPDVAAGLRVGLSPLGDNSDGQTFQRGHRLDDQKSVHKD